MHIKPINPVAREMAYNRPRTQIVKPKKGKGSYNRKRNKHNDAVTVDISKDASKKGGTY